MTTLHNTIKAYLLADADVFASPCGSRVYIDTWLPTGYTKSDGPALVFAPRGGPGSVAYKVASQTIVVRAFAELQSEAWAIDNAVFEAFRKTHNPTNSTLFYAKDSVSPTLQREAGGMYVVSSSYQVAEVL